jgi:methyl-accepting chemotaxis protein
MLNFSQKLYLGFFVVLVLLGFVGVASYFALHTASSGFEQYRSYSTASNEISQVQSNLLMVRMNVKDFLISSDEKDVQEFDKYWKETQRFMDSAIKDISNSERDAVIREVAVLLADYEQAFKKVVALRKQP